MKELLAYLFQFAIVYGTKDKEKFREHALIWLEKYQLEEQTREEFVDFAYEFLANFAVRLQNTQVVRSGVRQGVSSLEKQMEDLNEKLDKILQKMPGS
jgi:hypothetical protein